VNFEVYRGGKLVKDFELSGHYMFGADNIALRGVSEMVFDRGVIRCIKRSNDAAGIALLWPINGFGRVILPTTRLPERIAPYNLNLELARAKLMEITTKLEDWSFFDDNKLLSEAKSLFVQALENIENGSVASSLADESLKKAIIFAEGLAVKNAEVAINNRKKKQGHLRHMIGCKADSAKLTKAAYLDKLCGSFGFVNVGIDWAQVETNPGVYNFAELDKVFSALSSKRMAVCAGPLLDFTRNKLPQWLLDDSVSFDKLRESAYNFVSSVVERYSHQVHAWTVISGVNAKNYFGFNFEQALEITRASVIAARSANSRSMKIVELCYPWGEYYATRAEAIPPMVYLEMIMQSGINPDVIGVQMRFGKNLPGMHVRDMMQISAMLDRLAIFNKPIHITSLEVPGVGSKKDLVNAGYWRGIWGETLQSKWIEQFYKIALSKPSVNAITYSVFAEGDQAMLPASALVSKSLKSRKHHSVLEALQKTLLAK